MVFSLALVNGNFPILRVEARASIYDAVNREEETMAYKHSAIVALLAGSALYGLGGVSLAEDTKWGAPNVPGQPGYKEPPKADGVEVHAPRPAQDPRLGYHPKRSTETQAGSNR